MATQKMGTKMGVGDITKGFKALSEVSDIDWISVVISSLDVTDRNLSLQWEASKQFWASRYLHMCYGRGIDIIYRDL